MNALTYVKNKKQSQDVYRKMKEIVHMHGDDYHKIHFLERCNLCNLNDDSYKCYIDINTINEIKTLISAEKYREIIDKYIIPTYKDSDSKKQQYEYFVSIDDKDCMKYLAIGVLCERTFICQRNCITCDLGFTKDIDIQWLYEFALNDETLINESPTYYVNSLMYAWNIMGRPIDIDINAVINKFINRNISQDSESIYKYMYGITHFVIQLSGFYRLNVNNKPLLHIIEGFLNSHPIDDIIYLDIYCEAGLCYKILTSQIHDWISTLLIDKRHVEFFNNINIKNEHCCSLYIMIFNLQI